MPSPTIVLLNPTSLTIEGVGSTGTFTGQGDGSYFLTAKSENTSVATVRPGGEFDEFIVTATGMGTTFVDVTSPDGGFAQESVTVYNSGTIVNVKGGR